MKWNVKDISAQRLAPRGESGLGGPEGALRFRALEIGAVDQRREWKLEK